MAAEAQMSGAPPAPAAPVRPPAPDWEAEADALSGLARLVEARAPAHPAAAEVSAPSREILRIWRRARPDVALAPALYETSPDASIRQWHPPILMPSQLREIQGTACPLRPVLVPVVVWRDGDGDGAAEDEGSAAVAAKSRRPGRRGGGARGPATGLAAPAA